MYSLLELLKLQEGIAEYPANHQPGMKVTKGGSMCKNCEYWVEKGNKCDNTYWLKWHDGKAEIPENPDEYCCNWWHAK